MRSTKNNLGKQLEEILKLKNKAQIECEKAERNYIQLAQGTSKTIVAKLEKIISDENKSDLEKSDLIFEVLVNKFSDSLADAKDKYDFWFDLNEKFNS